MSDYSELKKLAERAPGGPWFGPDYAPGTGYVFDNCLGSLLHYESIEYEQESCLSYVAAANPAVVLALIAENEALRKDAERLSYMIRTRVVVEQSKDRGICWLTFPDGYVTREVFQDPKVALDWAIIKMAKPND